MKGTYILILQLDQFLTGLQIGKLGVFDLVPGYYLYVGSAFGAGGLNVRLAHHRRKHKPRPHWHIDYLRPVTRLREAWTVSGPERYEIRWCQAMAALPDLSMPIPNFGASDSRCRTHLFYTPRPPRSRWLTGIVLECVPYDRPFRLAIEIHAFDE